MAAHLKHLNTARLPERFVFAQESRPKVIDISDDRSWNDPVGTRVFKTLRMGDQRVENGQLRRRRVAGSAACTPGTATMPP